MKSSAISRQESKTVKYTLITISILFVFFMLVLPLVSVITNSLKEGFFFYINCLKDEYVMSALKVTLLTIFRNCSSLSSDKVFLPWKAGAGSGD